MGLFNKPKAPVAPAEPETKTEATPLTREDVQTMLQGAMSESAAQLNTVVSQLKDGIAALAERQPVVVDRPIATAPVEAQITDEDIDNAVASGQGAARLVRGLLDKQARDIASGFDRKFNELAEFGVTAIANLTAESLKTLPHYGRYKKEIDQKVGALPPAMRANPDTLKLIYNSVVGEHADDLQREAREAAVRGGGDTSVAPVNEIDTRAPGGVGKPGGGGVRAEKPAIPSAEEFAGREGMMALQHKERGKDPDAFAKSMGYQDWNHYITQYQQLQAENDA